MFILTMNRNTISIPNGKNYASKEKQKDEEDLAVSKPQISNK